MCLISPLFFRIKKAYYPLSKREIICLQLTDGQLYCSIRFGQNGQLSFVYDQLFVLRFDVYKNNSNYP